MLCQCKQWCFQVCVVLLFFIAALADALQLIPLSYQTDDYLYYVTAGVGTPAQPFRLVVDTGSANLWVPSSSCASLACTQRAQYNPDASTTSKVLGTAVPIRYGSGGSVLAALVSDVVMLPAPNSSSSSSSGSGTYAPGGVRFTQQLGMATQMRQLDASSDASQPWDGILGMGLPALAAGGVQVPVLSLLQQGVVDAPVFGLYTVPNASAAGSGGELALGGWNAARVQGSLTWIDVVTPTAPTLKGFWAVPIQQVQLDWPSSSSRGAPAGSSNGPAGACSSSVACVGLVDSGTSLIYGSIEEVAAVNAALGGSPSLRQLPFSCTEVVARVLAATADALSSNTPDQAANAVCSRLYGGDASSLEAMLCSAVQLQLSALTLGPPNQPVLSTAQQQSVVLCEQLPYVVNVTLSCKQVQDLPTVSFSIGGSTFSIEPTAYTYQNYYTVYDYGSPAGAPAGSQQAKPRIGLGRLNAAEQAASAALFDQALASKQSSKFDLKPKKPMLAAKYNDEKDLTKMINQKNESNAAGKAQQSGGQLSVVKAPVLAPADQKQKAKQAKAAAPS
ncbi:aspartic peptidase domain-containing protein [Scenedesmus sp. NREL 46B-D3]|nr:aspartic peptidase domain-containing protein [Scenedesmus sp. NREL 46B-D3]